MLSEENKDTAALKSMTGLPERIILTGFRGTGKTHVGLGLAVLLGYDFIDTDDLLAKELHSSLADFIRAEGWEAFRLVEKHILTGLVHCRKTVIATGGGAVLHHEIWQDLRKDSLVIWLQADPRTIRQRLKEDEASAGQRPPLTGNTLSGEVEEVLAFRKPYYEKGSDLAIDTTNMSPEDIIHNIGKLFTGEEQNKV